MSGKTWNKQPARRKNELMLSAENRLVLLVFNLMLGFALVIGKLIYVQVVKHDDYRKAVQVRLENKRELPAKRGSVMDRNGELLAIDLMHYSLAVKPALLENPQEAAAKISSAVNLSASKILRKIRGDKRFVYLRHRLSIKEARELQDMKLKGVILEKKYSRYYPYEHVGAQMIGYCDYDNAAKGGLELQYDEYLKGTSGSAIYLRDALGNQYPNLDFPTAEAVDGYNVETTINVTYQAVLDDELKKAVLGNNANSGSAVLLDPRTGEVLGMANYPTFNPNRYNDYSIEKYRNRAIADVYEPGSTFKAVSLALALDHLNMDLNNELVFCENGRYRLADNYVKDHKSFAYLTAKKVFEQSSNIGVIKLSSKFKATDFYRYARDFGVGQESGIDLPAEANGILHRPGNYSRYSVAYMSMGYEVAVTPLQMASVYSAIANDGQLMQPYVVKRITDRDGSVIRENRPLAVRQVVSPSTARRMKKVLHGVVENGTGKTAQVPGLTIAGKTGTAQKIDRKTRSYRTDRHVASFAGFFPVEAPRFTLFILINNPRKAYYGSQVAAPVFRNIANRIVGLPVRETPGRAELAHLKLPSISNYMLALEGMELSEAVEKVRDRDLPYEVVGDGKVVYRQEPPAYSMLNGRQKVLLYTETRDIKQSEVMPLVKGLTVREAMQVLAEWKINLEIDGSGVVYEQLPRAGVKMREQQKVLLRCRVTD